MDKISVIIPVYNVEKHLNKCFLSVINQRYVNSEVVFVDDGTTDICAELCDEYASLYDNVFVIHKSNGGLSDARNVGIRAAAGEWIAFVDSDDYLHSNYLMKLFDAVTRDDSDLSVCDFIPIHEDGTIIEGWGDLPNVVLSDHSDMIRMIDSHWKIVPAWNKLYKASLFDDLEFAKGKLHEDEFLIHQLLAKCNKVTLISDALYYYLQRKGSITATKTIQNRLDVLEAGIQRYTFCKERDLPTNKDFISLDYLDKVVTDSCRNDKSFKKRYKSLRRQYKKVFLSEKSNRKLANYIRYYNNSFYYKIFRLIKR